MLTAKGHDMRRQTRDELITVERWRLEQALAELDEYAYLILENVPDPWQDELRVINFKSHREIDEYRGALSRRTLEALNAATPMNRFGEQRTRCPFCGEERQDGIGYRLDQGMQTHWKDCTILRIWRHCAHRHVNQVLDRPPLSSYIDD